MHTYHKYPDEEGQSLVEYGMILVLVAVAVIAIVTLFGSQLGESYCKVVYQLFPDTGASGACSTPIASPQLVSQGPNHINIEVMVNDPDGDPSDPYGAIARVEFYVDSTSGSPVHTEYFYRYCLGGNSGTNPCNNFSTGSLSSGRHTIYIMVYDDDGNVGQSSYSFAK